LSYYHSHITTAIKIIETAKQGEPLMHHLKRTFAANKKFGSKDRKSISSLCYNYYRLGNALKNKTIEERIIAAIFICTNTSNKFLEALAPALYEQTHLSIHEKCVLQGISPKHIFPFLEELGADIDFDNFAYSFLKQPLFFLRIRVVKKETVYEKLKNENVVFEVITDNCIALPQTTKIDEILILNKEVVVQDYNSQGVFNYIQNEINILPKLPKVWDCCAASGGKSILIYDTLKGNIDLKVSDIRPAILNNLKARFKDAGIKNYHTSLVDMSKSESISVEKKYDVIICDAPCTGSGTWARTPEQLAFFNKKSIIEFVALQKSIASNAKQQLKKGGLFFYITCSVFKKENEGVVKYLQQNENFNLLYKEYLKGYDMQADTMFVAVFTCL
jgi:16S rRNA (cytosine967-C5)-methyltransferase